MTAILKIVCYRDRAPEKGPATPQGSREHGKHWLRQEGVVGSGQEPLLWFLWEGMGRQGKQV